MKLVGRSANDLIWVDTCDKHDMPQVLQFIEEFWPGYMFESHKEGYTFDDHKYCAICIIMLKVNPL